MHPAKVESQEGLKPVCIVGVSGDSYYLSRRISRRVETALYYILDIGTLEFQVESQEGLKHIHTRVAV